MNNEVKEILAYFEEYVKIIDMHDSEPMLNWKDLKIILDYITNLQDENENLKEYNEHLARSIKDYEELLLEKQTIINQTREMLYKRELDDYDTYTANVICDIQSDFEEIFRGEY